MVAAGGGFARRLLEFAGRDWERPVLLVLYGYIVAVIFIEVVRRFVFSYSSVWGEETARYAFAYLVWIGAAAAVRERAHIRIGVIFQFVSPRVKAFLHLLGEVLTFAFGAMALYYSLESVLTSIKFESLTSRVAHKPRMVYRRRAAGIFSYFAALVHIGTPKPSSTTMNNNGAAISQPHSTAASGRPNIALYQPSENIGRPVKGARSGAQIGNVAGDGCGQAQLFFKKKSQLGTAAVNHARFMRNPLVSDSNLMEVKTDSSE